MRRRDRSPTPLWGVTLDDVSDTDPIVRSFEALPVKPTARVVFDGGTRPADYAAAIEALHPHAYLMGELVDSQYVRDYTVASYRQRAVDFVNSFSSQIDLWEVGNEVNGEWLGPTSQTVAKISAAYDTVVAASGRTALTLYYNPNCWSTASNEMFTWAKANIPSAMKAGLDYVFISYYPEDCNNYWPSQSGWQSVFDRLHQMFPSAQLGFGESGNSNDRDPIAAQDLAPQSLLPASCDRRQLHRRLFLVVLRRRCLALSREHALARPGSRHFRPTGAVVILAPRSQTSATDSGP